MADVKVTRDCYVPKENVKLYVSYETNPVVLDVRRKKKKDLSLILPMAERSRL